MGSFLDCKEENNFTAFEKAVEIKKRGKSLGASSNIKNKNLKNSLNNQKFKTDNKSIQSINSSSSEDNNTIYNESPAEKNKFENNLSVKGKKNRPDNFQKMCKKLNLKEKKEYNKNQNYIFKQNNKKSSNSHSGQNSERQKIKKSKKILSSKVLTNTKNTTKDADKKNICLNNKNDNSKSTIKEIVNEFVKGNDRSEDMSNDFIIRNNTNNNCLLSKNNIDISELNNFFSESFNENIRSKEFDDFFTETRCNKSSNNYILTETNKDIIKKLKTLQKSLVTSHKPRNSHTGFKSRKCPNFFNNSTKNYKVSISIINSQIKKNIPIYRKESASKFRRSTYDIPKLKSLSHFGDVAIINKINLKNDCCSLGNYFLQDVSSFNSYNFNNSVINKSVKINRRTYMNEKKIPKTKTQKTNYTARFKKKLLYRDLIQVDIIFKNTQICHDLMENQKNNIITISYDILGKLKTKSILYDGYIYKVIENKNGYKFLERYFQITKNCFRYYNDFYTAQNDIEKPLVQFDIRHIKNDQIIDYKKFNKKNKTSQNKNINFAFTIILNQNDDKFIFASDDKCFGNNIYNIIVLLKNYYEDKFP